MASTHRCLSCLSWGRAATGFVLHLLFYLLLWQPADISDEWHSSHRDIEKKGTKAWTAEPFCSVSRTWNFDGAEWPGGFRLLYLGATRGVGGPEVKDGLAWRLPVWIPSQMAQKPEKMAFGNLPLCLQSPADHSCVFILGCLDVLKCRRLIYPKGLIK